MQPAGARDSRARELRRLTATTTPAGINRGSRLPPPRKGKLSCNLVVRRNGVLNQLRNTRSEHSSALALTSGRTRDFPGLPRWLQREYSPDSLSVRGGVARRPFGARDQSRNRGGVDAQLDPRMVYDSRLGWVFPATTCGGRREDESRRGDALPGGATISSGHTASHCLFQ